MKKIKFFAAVLLIIALLAGTFSACSDDDTAPTGETGAVQNGENSGSASSSKGEITFCYSKSDSLNPFFAQGVTNQMLATLYCDPLFKVDNTFTAKEVIAESAEINDKRVTVTLKSTQFSDGSSVTASDVKYSFDLAKKSTAYSAALSNVTSASVSGSKVVFNLSVADKYAKNVLTFPIVKSGTADDKDSRPIGSGRYKLDGTAQNPFFSVNTKNAAGNSAHFKTLSLLNLPDSDALINSLQIGNTDFIFDDLSTGSYKRINATVKEVSLNNMVFLGINSSNEFLANDAIRQAVSAAIDRNAIATTAYQGHSVASALPFHPGWSELSAASIDPLPDYDKTKAETILKDAGITEKNNKNVLLFNKKPITLKLIVNENNSFRNEAATLVSQQLEKIGFDVTVSVLSNENYIKAIKSGKYDLYIGEIKLSDNMDLNPLLKKGGSAFYGIKEDNAAISAYESFRSSQTTLAQFCDTFSTALPFIPLCFRNGVSAYSSDISSDVISYDSDKFYNIEQWS